MPRRSTRVATLTQDDIEVDEQEDVPNQNDSLHDADQSMDQADEVPEEKPAARSKKFNAKSSKSKKTAVKTEKTKKSRTRYDASDDERASQAAPPFDRDEFLNTARPIPQSSVKTVDGIMSDLQDVLHKLEYTTFGRVLDTAIAVEEAGGNTDEGQEAAYQLDLVMRQLVDAQQELETHKGCLDSLKQNILRDEVMGKLEDMYTTNVSDAIETYRSRTTRQKYGKHKGYFKFRERVWEVNHEDAMPPIGELLPREDDDSDIDSDIEVGGMTQDYRCPITLRPLTDPLTSKTCGHSFSAEAIREFITEGRGRAECPATGCQQDLTMSDLERNEELAKRATDAVRRAKQREEDSDESDGEVID